MRAIFVFALCLAFVSASLAQTAPTPQPELPKDPRALLELAKPHYNFSDPTLRPWHVKASYQIFNEVGKPTEQGTYQIWWVSPKVHRESWNRPHASRSDWFTGNGQHFRLESGDHLKFFEHNLQQELFAPLMGWPSVKPEGVQLRYEERKSGSAKFPCVLINRVQSGMPAAAASTPDSIYCFDEKSPVLRGITTWTGMMTTFDDVWRFEDKYLPHDITIYANGLREFTAHIEMSEALAPADAALSPTSEAVEEKGPAVLTGKPDGIPLAKLLNKVYPVYPPEAKKAGQTGVVLLGATIGIDGSVHDLEVISAPAKSLADAALEAVSQWKYQPYERDGQKIEIHTMINVVFTLGGKR
jgi:TonB family protein